jgi:hypothetical protein
MLKYKEYIEIIEKNNTYQSMFEKMGKWNIPLIPRMLERDFTVHKEEFFHVTDLRNRKKLEKLQRTKKTVSCFTDFKSEDIFTGADGIDNTYPAVFVLKGSYTFGGAEDLYTEPDSQGRRWIQPYLLRDKENEKLFGEISKEIKETFLKSPFGKEFTEQQLDLMFTHHHDIEGKTKTLIIETYFDITEKVLKKFKEDILFLFDRDTKKYNEVLGYNFKIQKIKMDEYHFPKFLRTSYRDVPNNFFPEGNNEDKIEAYKIAQSMNIELYETLDKLIDSL